MSAIAKKKLTPMEYLEIERAAPHKSEYFEGEMFAMAGASYRNTLIKENISREFGSRIKSGPCRGLSSDMRVLVKSTGLFTYPDYLTICGQPEFQDNIFDTLLNPNLIVEILSDSTEKYDRGFKFKHYRTIESLKEYVLVSQDSATIERFVRQANESWNLTPFTGLAGEFELATVPIQVPMAEIYRGVDFEESSPKRE